MNLARGFPIYEFENRFKKLQKELEKTKIDAVLITTEENFHYFSGLISQFWESPTRPMYLILPAKGNSPIAIIPDIMMESMKNTWITNIFSWPAPFLPDDGVTLLADKLKGYKNLGIPMNIETSIRMPLLHLLNIKEKLQFKLVDVSEIISNIRLVKSELEIQKIETICQIASDCFIELPSRLESLNLPHITERIAVREMKKLLINKGADTVRYCVGKSGIDGYKSVVDGPGDEILVPGSIFVIDTGAILDGYYCDFNRNYIINKNSEKNYLKENLLLWEATECALKIVKPGKTFSDLWYSMVNYLSSNGINKNDYSTGRIGHSLGLQLTELPSIQEGEKTILKEGMVITLEPFLNLKNGIIVHEECIVITSNGYRLLTKRCPKESYELKVKVKFDELEVKVYNSLQMKLDISEKTQLLLKEFDEKQELCKKFHEQLDDKITPLTNLNDLEKELNIKEIIVKDEGKRFGLKSFKGLGSSFAINMLDCKPKVLCTMTDGNHGKGVAFTAQKLGMKCIIYVPNNMSNARIKAIEEYGAKVIVVEGSYDDAIEEVKIRAKENNWCLVSDTSWKGYEEIPKNIMIGYGTIFREIEFQRKGKLPITHVVIQAGVGGLASSAAAWLHLNKNRSNIWNSHVKLIIVEPSDADCIAYNVMKQRNKIKSEILTCIGKTDSIMSGLNCGTPSTISWPIIRDIASTYITIGDEWARIAMKKMYATKNKIISGEAGAAGVACILATCKEKYMKLFDENSVILTINTEADTDPISFQEIIDVR